MKRLIRNFIIILVTLTISLSCIYIISKLYKSASVSSSINWQPYHDEEFNFYINYQKKSKVIEKNLSNSDILKQLSFKVYSPGIFKDKYENFIVNIIKKENFKRYIDKNRVFLFNQGVNSYGEKYSYGLSTQKYNLYFFEYNDYVFEVKIPLSGYDFSSSKLREMSYSALLSSFKRDVSTK